MSNRIIVEFEEAEGETLIIQEYSRCLFDIRIVDGMEITLYKEDIPKLIKALQEFQKRLNK